jgi:CBS domain-containing protein
MSIISLTAVSSSSLEIPGFEPWYADAQDPALTVMTDFRERGSITVPDTAVIDKALEHMRHTGVRCAFAVDEPKCVVVGLITAYDIAGEKPMQYMQSRAIQRRDVLVRDIMQAISDCRVVDIKQIEVANVVAVSAMFAKYRLTHVPVTETSGTGEQRLRGLLSAAKVRRLLSRPGSFRRDFARDAATQGIHELRAAAHPAVSGDQLLTPTRRNF